jgi:hypothetical protein
MWELDDHRPRPVRAERDHEVDVGIVFDLRLDHLRLYSDRLSFDPSEARRVLMQDGTVQRVEVTRVHRSSVKVRPAVNPPESTEGAACVR